MARVMLENVRVEFPIYGTQRNLRKVLFDRATGGLIQRRGKKQDRVVVKALDGVSLSFEDGDRVALIGHNGSGKSTLLKVLAGIYEPIEGRLLVEGRVTPLFDMMPGMDVEDSGYENIITAGLLLGLSRDEVESKIPDVEEFSELGEYLALPVRTYSTGMMMRLGFALVTALDPDVLLMDEGIGAGDARFAERAEQRLNEFVGRSRIVVLASHTPQLIRSLCNKAVLLQAGHVVTLGDVEDVFEQYDIILHGPKIAPLLPAAVAKLELEPPAQPEPPVEPERPAEGEPPPQGEPIQSAAAGPEQVAAPADQPPQSPVPQFIAGPAHRNEFAECIGGAIETLGGDLCGQPQIDVPFRIAMRYRLLKEMPEGVCPCVHLFDRDHRPFLSSTPAVLPAARPGIYDAYCRIDPFVLNAGPYSAGLSLATLSSTQTVVIHFFAEQALHFIVTESPDADPRRHGYREPWPGTTRARLQWRVARLDEPGDQLRTVVPAVERAES